MVDAGASPVRLPAAPASSGEQRDGGRSPVGAGVVGGLLVALGVVALLANFEVFGAWELWRLWSLTLVGPGLAFLLARRRRNVDPRSQSRIDAIAELRSWAFSRRQRSDRLAGRAARLGRHLLHHCLGRIDPLQGDAAFGKL